MDDNGPDPRARRDNRGAERAVRCTAQRAPLGAVNQSAPCAGLILPTFDANQSAGRAELPLWAQSNPKWGASARMMGRTFVIGPLPASRFRQAFSLIWLTAPHLALESWLRYAEALCRPDGGDAGGIVSAEDEDGYIYGMFCYRVAPDPRFSRTLDVEHFIALGLFDRSATTCALIDAVEHIARDRHCVQVQLALPCARIEFGKMDDSLHNWLGRAGYAVDGLRLCKRLSPAYETSEVH